MTKKTKRKLSRKYTARLSRRDRKKQKKNLKRKTYKRKTLKKREKVRKSKILIQNGGSLPQANHDRPPRPRDVWGKEEEEEDRRPGLLSCFRRGRGRGSDYKIDSPEPEPEPEMWETAVAVAWNGIDIKAEVNDENLMDSYIHCNKDISSDISSDDILSSLRCAYEKDSVKMYRGISPLDIRCGCAMGVFQEEWFEERYDIDDIFGLSDFTGWFELTELLNSGGHYLASVNTGPYYPHSFVLEFKNTKFRILSADEGLYSYFDFPSRSRWGSFEGHPDWVNFTNLMALFNGGPLLDSDGSKIIVENPLESQISTWEWTHQELTNSRAMFRHFFSSTPSLPVEDACRPVQLYLLERHSHSAVDKEVTEILRLMDYGIIREQWRHREFTEYPKGKVIQGLRVFLKINGLK